jgi:hypothetical protein
LQSPSSPRRTENEKACSIVDLENLLEGKQAVRITPLQVVHEQNRGLHQKKRVCNGFEQQAVLPFFARTLED